MNDFAKMNEIYAGFLLTTSLHAQQSKWRDCQKMH
jgi:hypothetical protein